MTNKITNQYDATDKKVIHYTRHLEQHNIRIRNKNSYIISDKRIKVKLDRRNIKPLSDKIRGLHQLITVIKLSEKHNIPYEIILDLMDKNHSNPIEVHHNNHKLICDVSIYTKQQHDTHHRDKVLKEIKDKRKKIRRK